jgi:RimJ/RimL family protein N-acetyltransferase
VRIEPLTSAHADALYESCGLQQHADLWTYMGDGPFDSHEAFADNITRKSASTDPLFFALVDRLSGHAQGHAALMRIDAPNRVIELGNIMVGPSLQKSRAATETQFLLAKHVFEELGYRRYEWKCNDLNAPSKRAAVRFGFSYEGLFRQHMIVKGRNRDTAWFSMLDTEWPTRKAAFECWLAPDNFDAAGQQKVSLAALMKGDR